MELTTHDPEAVIAGTLSLMSCYVQHPAAVYAERVADNLARIAQLASLSPEMRTVCRRLAQRWQAIRDEAHARAAAGEAVSDARPLH
ncbi:MAG: hypothetical protein IT518_09145 [Burkholderiales bacterium]|nr:hypothetical protein [Burkholderiales bacterium]